MMQRVSDFLAWLGGADKGLLAKVPQERGKFVQMGCVLLTTSSIAAVSMIFAMHDGVKVLLAGAIVFGLFWGLIIINLDRFLVLSMGSTRDLGRLVWISLPRLLLAAVISLVIATPLTLRIFQSDINVALNSANLKESSLQQQQLKSSGLQQQASAVLAQITTDKATLAGHLPESVTNPALQTAQQQVTELQPKVQAAKTTEIHAYEAWQCELYGDGTGCAGASNRAGNGPIAHAKELTYQADLKAYNQLNAQLLAAQRSQSAAEQQVKRAQGSTLATAQQAARAQLPSLEARYNGLEQQVRKKAQQDQNALNRNTGILAQLSALSAASSHNFALFVAQMVVTLLFFFIELLPVTVKFLLNLGPPSTYEKVAKLEEEKILDQARLDRLTQRRNAERESDEQQKRADAATRVRVNVTEDMSNREQAMGIHANEHVAGKMEEILDAALQQWSQQVHAKLNGAAAQLNGNGSSPHPQMWQAASGFGLDPDGGML